MFQANVIHLQTNEQQTSKQHGLLILIELSQ